MDQDVIIEHLMDIKERIASIEAKSDDIQATLVLTGSRFAQQDVRIQLAESKIAKVETSFKLYQWATGIIVALSAAFIKSFKN